jgi:hypothetical protein
MFARLQGWRLIIPCTLFRYTLHATNFLYACRCCLLNSIEYFYFLANRNNRGKLTYYDKSVLIYITGTLHMKINLQVP